MNGWKDKWPGSQEYRETDRQTDMEADRQTLPVRMKLLVAVRAKHTSNEIETTDQDVMAVRVTNNAQYVTHPCG